jgi:hypothetical protein
MCALMNSGTYSRSAFALRSYNRTGWHSDVASGWFNRSHSTAEVRREPWKVPN